MFAHVDDTIVALSSAAGSSPRGVIRLSGPRAIEIALAVFVPPPDTRKGFRRHGGTAQWKAENVDVPAELYVFRPPRSYTRQDVAELHTIGSPPVLAGLLDEMLAAGARLAEPGEFTGRAFLAGAMDLAAAEGVAAMIHAGSDAQLRAAEQLLHGTLTRETEQHHSRLVDLLTLVEASIDFVEEPIDFLPTAQAAREIEAILAGLEGIRDRACPMERLDTRPRVALLGKPNVGKSTLFNRLVGLDRAICSPVPGTTRDVIGAPLTLPNTEVWLLDAAGVNETTDEIDALAQSFATQAARSADLVLYVVDAEELISSPDDVAPPPPRLARVLCVINKVDRIADNRISHAYDRVIALGVPVVAVSAATGAGCADLLKNLASIFQQDGDDVSMASIATNARHRTALDAAIGACDRARSLIQQYPRVADGAELIALELREANHQLGAIVGEVVTEEILARVFSRFCIGK
jgi:tRNA modification GTPase